MSPIVLHGAALIAYVVAAVCYGANFALRTRTYIAWARSFFILGILIHTSAIGSFCITTHQGPFESSFGTLSVMAWAVALAYVPLEFLSRAPAIGALAAPVASLLLFAAVLNARAERYASPVVRSRIINFHILIVIVSFALFALAACCAVFYIWQYGALKHPDKRALFRKLPPLETVDSFAYHLVAFALPLLTLGLLLGIVRAASGGLKGNWLLDPHTIISIAMWLVYSGYLVARVAAGWRGTRLNYLLIAGLVVALAIFFVPSTAHRFT